MKIYRARLFYTGILEHPILTQKGHENMHFRRYVAEQTSELTFLKVFQVFKFDKQILTVGITYVYCGPRD